MNTKRISKKNKITFIFALIILLTVSGFCMGAANAYSTGFQSVRVEGITVTDAGRFVNKFDTVYLPESRESIKRKGYTYIRITISSLMWEKDDGYQSVMLYTGEEAGSNKDEIPAIFIYEFKFEHSPGKIIKSQKTIINAVSVDLTHFTQDKFVIRYGASGKGEDTYYVRDVRVKFEYTNTRGNDYISIDGEFYVNKGAN